MPEAVRAGLKRRLEAHVAAHWKDRCREVQVRFRGVFAYVDALPVRHFFTSGLIAEQRAQIEATPTHLCRQHLSERMNPPPSSSLHFLLGTYGIMTSNRSKVVGGS